MFQNLRLQTSKQIQVTLQKWSPLLEGKNSSRKSDGEMGEEEGGGVKKKGRGLYELMTARCFRTITEKNSNPAVVIYHICQLSELGGHQTRQET